MRSYGGIVAKGPRFETLWRGEQVGAQVVRASKIGINNTMARAVLHAKLNHPWRNQTFTLEPSIRIQATARRIGKAIVGFWGSVNVAYASALEFGRPGRHKAFPYLRPAAAATYPGLGKEIQRAFDRL